MKSDVDAFIRDLAQCGVMSPTEVSDYLATFPQEKRPRGARSLAQELVRDGRLTRYQAKTILDGKAARLVLGEYLVVDMIGEGGMGQVVKAVHRTRQDVAAVKVLRPEWLASRHAVQRFHQEVEIAGQLHHENIVATLDFGEQGGSYYMAMEFVEGRDLAELVERGGAVPCGLAVDYILQAARGLAHAHGRGIIHRDIKPANLLLDAEGRIKILDMGLARIAEPEDLDEGATLAERLTRTGQMLGTVDYVSPEQAADTRSADHRSDIYSLGCTLYRLITGKPVYGGESAVQKLMAHCDAEIPVLTDSVPDVPARLAEVFMKMVAKKPQDRHQSMSEVISDLEACREEIPVSAGTGAGGRPTIDGAGMKGGSADGGRPPLEPTLAHGIECTTQLPTDATVSMEANKSPPQTPARLKVVEGPGMGRVLDLKPPKVVIGRHPDCDVALESMEASRHHAQLVLTEGEWLVEDLHSRNGTLLNGKPVRGRQKLRDGDRIFVGDTALTFHPSPQ